MVRLWRSRFFVWGSIIIEYVSQIYVKIMFLAFFSISFKISHTCITLVLWRLGFFFWEIHMYFISPSRIWKDYGILHKFVHKLSQITEILSNLTFNWYDGWNYCKLMEFKRIKSDFHNKPVCLTYIQWDYCVTECHIISLSIS